MAAIYCALMTDYCLDLLGARGDVIVEGRFAANEAFTSILAALRAPECVLRSSDQIGTLRGAAALSILARGLKPHAAALVKCASADLKGESLRVRWRSLLPQERHTQSKP